LGVESLVQPHVRDAPDGKTREQDEADGDDRPRARCRDLLDTSEDAHCQPGRTARSTSVAIRAQEIALDDRDQEILSPVDDKDPADRRQREIPNGFYGRSSQ